MTGLKKSQIKSWSEIEAIAEESSIFHEFNAKCHKLQASWSKNKISCFLRINRWVPLAANCASFCFECNLKWCGKNARKTSWLSNVARENLFHLNYPMSVVLFVFLQPVEKRISTATLPSHEISLHSVFVFNFCIHSGHAHISSSLSQENSSHRAWNLKSRPWGVFFIKNSHASLLNSS